MTVIELGDVTREPPHEVADRIGPRLRWVALAAVMLGVLSCGAAATAGDAGVRTLWSGTFHPESMLVAAGRTLYEVDGAALTAYDVADGRVRWTWRTGAAVIGIRPSADDGPVLVGVDPAVTDEPQPAHTTVALHAGTGAELWRKPYGARLETADAGSVLLVGYDPDGVARLSRVRLRDGATLWTRTVPGMQEVAAGDGSGPADRLAVSTAGGEVTVLRYADGAELIARRFDGVSPDPAGVVYVSLSLYAGRLLMFHNEVARSYTTVHDMATLREVFRSDPVTGPVFGCGEVLCRFLADEFTAIDPGTGRQLWRETSVIGLSLVAGDRILLDLADGRRHVLMDNRSGRPVTADLTGLAVPDRAELGSFLLLRPSVRPAGRTVLSRVDLGTGAQRLLGSLPAVPDPQACRTSPGYLVCPAAQRFVVAAVPR